MGFRKVDEKRIKQEDHDGEWQQNILISRENVIIPDFGGENIEGSTSTKPNQFQEPHFQIVSIYLVIILFISAHIIINCIHSSGWMCSRGVFQLKKLTVFFCDFGGSSNGVREMISSPQMKDFIQDNQQIEFEFICKRNHHPFIRGSYLNGYSKDMPVRNYNNQEVFTAFNALRNQLGRRAFKVSGSRIFNSKKSIQGTWQPNLFNKYPVAELSVTHQIPEIKDEYVVKTAERMNVRAKDESNEHMGLKDFTNPHRERQE